MGMFAVGITACSTAKTGDDVEVSQPTATSQATTSEPITRRGPEDGFTLASKVGQGIGEACADANSFDCGKDGRISIERTNGMNPNPEPEPNLPCQPVGLGNHNSGYWFSACVSGDHLIVASDCMICRMPSNTLMHARISMMTPKQHQQLLESMQIKTDIPASAADWRRVIDHNRVAEHSGPTGQ